MSDPERRASRAIMEGLLHPQDDEIVVNEDGLVVQDGNDYQETMQTVQCFVYNLPAVDAKYGFVLQLSVSSPDADMLAKVQPGDRILGRTEFIKSEARDLCFLHLIEVSMALITNTESFIAVTLYGLEKDSQVLYSRNIMGYIHFNPTQLSCSERKRSIILPLKDVYQRVRTRILFFSLLIPFFSFAQVYHLFLSLYAMSSLISPFWVAATTLFSLKLNLAFACVILQSTANFPKCLCTPSLKQTLTMDTSSAFITPLNSAPPNFD